MHEAKWRHTCFFLSSTRQEHFPHPQTPAQTRGGRWWSRSPTDDSVSTHARAIHVFGTMLFSFRLARATYIFVIDVLCWEMPHLVNKKLKEAQREQKTALQRARRRADIPLTSDKLLLALVAWWAAGRLACMGLRYLEMVYAEVAARRQWQQRGEGGAAHQSGRHLMTLPQKWRDSFFTKKCVA